ncbi:MULTISPECIES: hypothetical protein [Streptomyces]|uniref:Lipoprotein n=1 Tax=Streptomyces viridochromogenes TaxID=1938 RepID=A0A0L8JDP5_STRVR|nr:MULTISPECIES: hypothetical protein [Streptomyces]KOG11793.1 hypothetical protein ADK34_33345 [Streptomyces viridochromogenes]
MQPRRITLALIAVLLTSGCVAVPRPTAPAPPSRTAHLAPDAERAPAPIPTWPAPTPAAAREALTETDTAPRQADRPAGPPPRPAAPAVERATGTGAGRSPARGTVPKHPRGSVRKPGKPAAETRAVTPRAPKRNRAVSPRPQQQPTGLPSEMRRLCRQAEGIQAPMGAADLCRGMYGR